MFCLNLWDIWVSAYNIFSQTILLHNLPNTSSIDGPIPYKRPLTEEDDDISNRKKSKFYFDKENNYVLVYTDGSCENNGKSNAKAGIGVWFGDDHPL